MSNIVQAGEFIRSLKREERKDLCEAIAEDIYFLDMTLQDKVFELLWEVNPEFADEIRKINSFTTLL